MESYINSIFEKQSEQSMHELLTSFARENGHEVNKVDTAIEQEQENCSQDLWGGLRYSRGQIKNMLQQISE